MQTYRNYRHNSKIIIPFLIFRQRIPALPNSDIGCKGKKVFTFAPRIIHLNIIIKNEQIITNSVTRLLQRLHQGTQWQGTDSCCT